MDRGAWHGAVHGVAKSGTQLSDWSELKERMLPLEAPAVTFKRAPLGHSGRQRTGNWSQTAEVHIKGMSSVRKDFPSFQMCSVAQSFPSLSNPMDCSTLGFFVSHHLPEFAEMHLILSSHLILCRPLLLVPSIFPSIKVFSSESALRIRGPKAGVSASTSVLPMNTQD